MDHYLNDICNHVDKFIKPTVSEFLKLFDNVFTLNFDPVIYLNILNDKLSSEFFIDGFKGNTHLTVKDIVSRIEKNKSNNPIKVPLYYLHGAYYILLHSNNRYVELSKIVAGNISKNSINRRVHDEKFIKLSSEAIHEIFDDWKCNIPLKKNISLVLTTRAEHKKAEIDLDPYLDYVRDKLAEVKKLFIFGCSFEFDSHILELLALSEDLETVFISYLENEQTEYLDTRKNLSKSICQLISVRKNQLLYKKSKKLIKNLNDEIEKLKKFENKIIWVETSDFSNVIWEEPKAE